jgi:hypothetical protein
MLLLAAVTVIAPAKLRAAPSDVAGTGHRAGILRIDTVTGVWGVLHDTTHVPTGILSVTCSPTDGRLTVMMSPVSTITSFDVDPDDSYAGLFDFGASVGLDRLVVLIRRPDTRAFVACSSKELRIVSSNLQVSVWGTEPPLQ